MDKMKKLFKKVGKNERHQLKNAIKKLINGNHKGLVIKKVKSMQCFRVRVGRFRILFKITQGSIEVVDIRVRNEKTYK